jgi:hypothetical protein
MPSIINATTTNGVVTSGDNSGALVIATNNNVAAITIGTNQVATFAQQPAGTFAGTGPAFSVYNSSPQSLTVDTLNKITFNTELFDTNNNFASSRFTPTVAGYYQFNCGVRCDANPLVALHVQVRANNTTSVAQGSFTNTGLAAFMSSCSGLAYLNGTTDYVEVYCYSGTSASTNPGIGLVYFQGVMVRAA